MSNTLSESQTLTHIHTESEEAQIVKMSVQSKLQPKKKLIEDVEYRKEEKKLNTQPSPKQRSPLTTNYGIFLVCVECERWETLSERC